MRPFFLSVPIFSFLKKMVRFRFAKLSCPYSSLVNLLVIFILTKRVNFRQFFETSHIADPSSRERPNLGGANWSPKGGYHKTQLDFNVWKRFFLSFKDINFSSLRPIRQRFFYWLGGRLGRCLCGRVYL